MDLKIQSSKIQLKVEKFYIAIINIHCIVRGGRLRVNADRVKRREIRGWTPRLEIKPMATCAKPTRSATASYIEAMLVELRKMGDEMDADFLVYLLEMALIEASDLAERPAEDPFQRLRTKSPATGDLRPPGTL